MHEAWSVWEPHQGGGSEACGGGEGGDGGKAGSGDGSDGGGSEGGRGGGGEGGRGGGGENGRGSSGENGHGGGGEGGHGGGGEGGHGGHGSGEGGHASRGEGQSGASDPMDVVEGRGTPSATAVVATAAPDDDGNADGDGATVAVGVDNDDDDLFDDVPQEAVDSVVLVLILLTFGLTFVYFQVLEQGMAPPWHAHAEPQQASGLLYGGGCFGRGHRGAAWCKVPSGLPSGWNPLGGTYLDSAALPREAPCAPPAYE